MRKMILSCPAYTQMSEGGYHGKAHAENVLKNAQKICAEMNIPMSMELEAACLLHDVGRTSDKKDDNHGSVSIEKCLNISFPSSFNFERFKIMVEGHCKKPDVDKSRFLDFQILCDADRMDRVRLKYLKNPLKSLNVKYFHTEEAKKMIEAKRYDTIG